MSAQPALQVTAGGADLASTVRVFQATEDAGVVDFAMPKIGAYTSPIAEQVGRTAAAAQGLTPATFTSVADALAADPDLRSIFDRKARERRAAQEAYDGQMRRGERRTAGTYDLTTDSYLRDDRTDLQLLTEAREELDRACAFRKSAAGEYLEEVKLIEDRLLTMQRFVEDARAAFSRSEHFRNQASFEANRERMASSLRDIVLGCKVVADGCVAGIAALERRAGEFASSPDMAAV